MADRNQAAIPNSLAGCRNGPTWRQYKARRYRNSRAKERHSPKKSYAADLHPEGYAYQLCVADNMTSPTKAKWKQQPQGASSGYRDRRAAAFSDQPRQLVYVPIM